MIAGSFIIMKILSGKHETKIFHITFFWKNNMDENENYPDLL